MNDGGAYVGKRNEPVAVILLSIVTCGIYGIYWLYVVGQDINKVLGREAINPLFLFLGILFSPLILYSLYLIDKALEEVGTLREMPYKPNFILWLILTLVCGVGVIVAYYQISSYLNTVWDKDAGAPPLQQ